MDSPTANSPAATCRSADSRAVDGRGGSPWPTRSTPAGSSRSFDLHDGAVATSGTAERGRHLWDGRTGRPAGALASVTVLGPHLTWADALATAAFALGDDGPDWIEELEGYEAVAVDPRGRLRVTAGLQVVGAAA